MDKCWLATVGRQPATATTRFNYGYGRAEDLGGLFVIAMITLSSALAGYEAIDRLIHPREISHLGAVAAAAVVSFAGNELVARYRIRLRALPWSIRERVHPVRRVGP